MKILIRCDSSLKIGTGHVTRCLTLADLLKRSGHDVTFVCRELSGNIINIVKERQFPVISLPPQSNESASAETVEITDFSAPFNEITPEFIIVDHYAIGENWERHFSNLGAKIFVIDDVFRKHHADFVLDQNLHDNALLAYQECSKGAKLFLGPAFALLSPQFLSQELPQRSFDHVKRALIFFGGSDEAGETLRLLKLIQKHQFSIEHIDVVIGFHNPFKEEIKAICNSNDGYTLHIQTNRMSDLMREADIFIGASGSTTWERCYLGLPSICMAVADNQVEVARNLEIKGVLTYLGLSKEISDEKYVSAIQSILTDKKLRENYSKKSHELKVSSKLNELIKVFS